MAKRSYLTIGWNQKETHRLRLKVEKDGEAYRVNNATITAWCKRRLDSGTDYIYEKADTDFEKDIEGNPSWIEVTIDGSDNNYSGEAYLIIQYDKGDNEKPKSIIRFILEATPEEGP